MKKRLNQKLNKIVHKYNQQETFVPIYINHKITGYLVSNHGRVLNLNYRGKSDTPRFLKQDTNHGYKRVTMSFQGQLYRCRVHRLVADAFIPNPFDLPVVNHKDGNKANNNVNNLEWVTEKENTQHAIRTGLLKMRGEDSPNCKNSEENIRHVCEMLEQNEKPISVIAKECGVTRNIVGSILFSGNWGHISKEYNIKQYNQRTNGPKKNSDIIKRICQLIEDGADNEEIVRIIGVPSYVVNDIRKKRTYTKISSKYNF